MVFGGTGKLFNNLLVAPRGLSQLLGQALGCISSTRSEIPAPRGRRYHSPVWSGALALYLALHLEPCTADEYATSSVRLCWVFNRMPKAGSSTIDHLFTAWADENHVRRHAFNFMTWARKEKREAVRNGDNIVVTGGYAEALRAMGWGNSCKWFTMFRHPVSRLVSAFYFCKYKWPHDQACGRGAIDLETADIYAFAKFWSNYATRQFIMAFFTPEEILASPAVQAVQKKYPAWYKIGVYVNELYANDSVHNNDVGQAMEMHDIAMTRFLRPAMEVLNTYAAVAILEDFDKGLQLFQRALALPGLEWTRVYEMQGTANEGVEKSQEGAALKMAQTDPDIRKFLWLDLVLYDHAVALYRNQLVEYGLA